MAELNGLEGGLPPVARDLTKPVRGHIVELDSLRGVAALVVVFDHFEKFWSEVSHPGVIDTLRRSPLGVIERDLIRHDVLRAQRVCPHLAGASRQAIDLSGLRRQARLPHLFAVSRRSRSRLAGLLEIPWHGDVWHRVSPDVAVCAGA